MNVRKSLSAAAWGFLLMALPALAADRAIYSGIDLWHTEGDGSSYNDFAKEPIPAGFFCEGSAPFTGRIIYRGKPVATAKAGELGRADTVIHRLDDAVFDKKGVAITRLQMKALSLESILPIKTSCGQFNVKVSLAGEQPITRMRIIRDSENGGRYVAPLAVNTRLTFTRVGAKPNAEKLELDFNIRFNPAKRAVWAASPGVGGLEKAGFVSVDTDGDGRADTSLPGTSNFFAGWNHRNLKALPGSCHCANEECTEQHCTNGQIIQDVAW
jgi:hypothetical protein